MPSIAMMRPPETPAAARRRVAGTLARVAALAVALVTAALAPGLARAQSYAVAPTPFAWIPSTGHAAVTTWDAGVGCPDTRGDDSLSPPLPIGFGFRFGATVHTQVRINVNGRLQFANTRCFFGTQAVGPPRTYPDPMPDPDVDRTLRIYGADLDVSTRGTITWATVGTAPNRTFVATWNDVPQWDTGPPQNPRTAYRLQVQLYEDGAFAFMYGVSDDVDTGNRPMGPAQLGWQLTTGDFWAQAGLPANETGLRFTPTNRPRLVVANTVDVLSDPASGTANPKRIPGSVQRYAVAVRNAGPAPADAGSLVVTNVVAAGTELCVAAACAPAPVEFVDGTPASGLTLPAGAVTYTRRPGGAAPFDYVPVPGADGYDPAVTGLRIAPAGTLGPASGAGQPGFTVRYRVRVR